MTEVIGWGAAVLAVPVRLRGIVRTDISGDSASDVAGICRLARLIGAALEPVLIADSDADYPLLFALLPSSVGLVVPDGRYLGHWLSLLRGRVQIWTLRPLGRVPGGDS